MARSASHGDTPASWRIFPNLPVLAAVPLFMKIGLTCLTVVAGSLFLGLQPATSATNIASGAEIRELLRRRLDATGGADAGVGVVVGVVEPRGRRVVAVGQAAPGRPATGDSVFEIGSVGKLFTALLLADMAVRHEVSLTDPAARYLPQVSIPQRNGRRITLADLATHTSGLPFLTDERPVVGGMAYGRTDLYRFLARYELPREPGAAWDYSNLGYWLLGEALAARGGAPIDELLAKRVFTPLGLRSTATALPASLAPRAAVGHNAVLRPAMSMDAIGVYAAMGPAAGVGVVSTVDDLLTLLSAAMGNERSPLARSLAAMLDTRRPMGGAEQALGWIATGDGLLSHDGGTWGFVSSVVWDSRAKEGVVVLSNQLTPVDDIAVHLLRPDAPLRHPSTAQRAEIAIDPAVANACVGRFEVEDEGEFIVSREGGDLALDVPVSWGLPRFRLRPETQKDFFVAELPLRVTFEWSEGRVTGMLVHPPRGAGALHARRHD